MKLKISKQVEYSTLYLEERKADEQVSFWRGTLMHCAPMLVQNAKQELDRAYAYHAEVGRRMKDFLLNDDNFEV